MRTYASTFFTWWKLFFVSSFIPYHCIKELYKYSQFLGHTQAIFLLVGNYFVSLLPSSVVKLTLQIYEISTYDPSTMLFFLPYGDAGGPPRGKIRNLPLISKHFIFISLKIVLAYVVKIPYICTVIETLRGGGAINRKPPPLGRATQCRGVSFSIGPRIFAIGNLF